MALIRLLVLLCVVLGSIGQVHAAVCTSDSDPKNDPYVQGAVKLGSGLVLRDQCQADGTLVQVNCHKGVYSKTAPTACPAGSACAKGSGACKKLPLLLPSPKLLLTACSTDSDPANDPFVTGAVKLQSGQIVKDQCDGPHMKGMTCEKLGYFGGDLGCDKSDCQLDTSGCFGGPGDPYGAPSNDPNYVPACGNGALDVGEACDSAIPYSAWKYSPALKKKTCEGLGYYAGQVFCSSSCQIAKEYCYGIPGDNYAGCGDGKVLAGEQCDCGVPLYWYKLKGKEACFYTKTSCKKLGFYGGALYCDASCGFIYSECDGWGSDPYGVPPDKYAQ